MSIRTRILLGAIFLIVLPLVALTLVVRQRLASRETRRFNALVTEQLDRASGVLLKESARVEERLAALARAASEDNRLRLALVGGRDDLKPYVRDFADRARDLTGLAVLQLQDQTGRILSSGHYRNEYDRIEPDLPRLLRSATWARMPVTGETVGVLVVDRDPDGEFLALEHVQDLPLGDQTFSLVGGVRITSQRLADLRQAPPLNLVIVSGSGPLAGAEPLPRLFGRFTGWDDADALRTCADLAGYASNVWTFPLIRDGAFSMARLLVTYPRAGLKERLHELDLTLGLTLLVTLVGALVLALWVADRLSRPLRDLTARAEQVDLDAPARIFRLRRWDEVGRLANVLDQMMARLRDSAVRLQAAEHRATLGEVARQVNHDVRNGLTPLRNVFRHLLQVAEHEPEQLPAILAERRTTLESGLAYLEDLATNYARLSPPRRREACDLVEIAHQAADAAPPAMVLADDHVPPVMADPVSLRRILDNLLRNAQEALPAGGGVIGVLVTRTDDGVVCEVRDNGRGIPAGQLDRIFEDFYTTKKHGTGLGLSNVRRLVADCGGHITVDSVPDEGTTFTITLPTEADA